MVIRNILNIISYTKRHLPLCLLQGDISCKPEKKYVARNSSVVYFSINFLVIFICQVNFWQSMQNVFNFIITDCVKLYYVYIKL